MFRFAKHPAKPAPERTVLPTASPAPASGRLGLSTTPAAWPAGASRLAIAVDACQRCDTAVACADYIQRAPNPIVLPPAFCPDPDAFRTKRAKERG